MLEIKAQEHDRCFRHGISNFNTMAKDFGLLFCDYTANFERADQYFIHFETSIVVERISPRTEVRRTKNYCRSHRVHAFEAK